MAKSTKNKKQWTELIILCLIGLISFFLWNTYFVYPIKLIVVFLHETSHAMAAILTGGQVSSMDVDFNLGGRCVVSGGNDIIIASSGYLGSFVFGALFFYAAYNLKHQNFILLSIFTIILLFAINLVIDFGIQILTLIFVIMLLLSLKYLPKIVNSYILKSIGLISCFYVIIDIKEDILNSQSYISDATILKYVTGIPEFLWGIFWIVISLVGFFFLINFGVKKQ